LLYAAAVVIALVAAGAAIAAYRFETRDVDGMAARATLRGSATLDGRPLDADFIGARVARGGLVTACQAYIPPVTDGRYDIRVMSDAEGRGCGAAGSEILLWTYADGRFLYSRETTPWPGDGATLTFNVSFSTSAPEGSASPVTSFKGHVARRDGVRLGGGTVVEAFIGEVRCGVSTVRRDDEAWFTLLVAGPQVPGCLKDGLITFRADGKPAVETAHNDLGGDAAGQTIQITVD
jgi:hypothetical protein